MSEMVIDPETGEILEEATPDVELRPDDELAEDEDPDADRAPEPEPPAEPAMSESELEKAFVKLDKESKRHRARLGEIMGDDAGDLIQCELCDPNFAGYRLPGAIEPAQRDAIALAIGLTGEIGMIEDPETRKCPYCDGMGETVTGSKVQGQTTRACPKCAAKGWMNEQEWNAYDATNRSREAMGAHLPEQPPAPTASFDLAQFDAWTRPRGHEFYGMNPVYMTPEQRARDFPGAR